MKPKIDIPPTFSAQKVEGGHCLVRQPAGTIACQLAEGALDHLQERGVIERFTNDNGELYLRKESPQKIYNLLSTAGLL